MGKVFIKNVNICVRGRGYRIRTEHEMGIVDVKKTYTLPELLRNRENVRIGDSVVLPEFSVPETTMGVENTMKFETLTIKDVATVYDIKDGKMFLVFNHGLFRSAIDNNDNPIWEQTQLHDYLRDVFRLAMNDNGIPAERVSLLSKDELFGDNALPFFRNGRNRIAFDKSEDCSTWYWLKTPDASSAHFCGAASGGNSYYDAASSAVNFVRPRFVIA